MPWPNVSFSGSGPPFSQSANGWPRCDAERPHEPGAKAPDVMRQSVAPVSAHGSPLATVFLMAAGVRDDLWQGLVWLASGCVARSILSWAETKEHRPDALLIIRWLSPVWLNGRHVSLLEYAPSLREQIRRPASKAIFPRGHLGGLARSFLFLA